MKTNLSERKMKILKFIVEEYISTAEPIGSRTISKNKDLAISAATIRNEMSDLEDMGYLISPHVSAGKVPSQIAYALYVDKLMKNNTWPLPAERACIAPPHRPLQRAAANLKYFLLDQYLLV